MAYMIGQLLGGVAVVLGFLAFQRKTQLGIILFQLAGALTFSAHYFLIDAPTAVVLNMLSAGICIGFGIRNKQNRTGKAVTVISVLLITIAGILAWESIYSVFLIAGLAVNVISLSFSNPQKTRRAMLLKSPLCMIYNIAATSLGGVVFECAVLTSAILGLMKNKEKTE
ncbi:MAG: YgjV family protein [Clostridia bacterium]|nr:YgjV family protein [Clostridia bacterium]